MCLLSSLSSATMTTGKLKISCFLIVFLFFFKIFILYFLAQCQLLRGGQLTAQQRRRRERWPTNEDRKRETRETGRGRRKTTTAQQDNKQVLPTNLVPVMPTLPAVDVINIDGRQIVSYFFCFSVLKW